MNNVDFTKMEKGKTKAQTRNQLGSPGRAKSFLRGDQIF